MLMKRLVPALLATLLSVLGCPQSAPHPIGTRSGPKDPPTAASTESGAGLSRTGPQELRLRSMDGETQVTIRLERGARRVELPGGRALLGQERDRDPPKIQYRAPGSEAVVYEVKEGEEGFKLRDGAGQLRWKVKLRGDKVKISDNEAGERPFVLVRKGDRVKLLRDERELGKVECRPDKLKVEDAGGQDRFEARGGPCSGAAALWLLTEVAPEERALLLGELWARGR